MKPNVLICGQTGSGKSTLINFIFKKEVAETGTAESVTRGIIPHQGDTINIYDSEGYEIGQERQAHFDTLFSDFLEEKSKGPVFERLHAVWYTVPVAGKRFTDTDKMNLDKIREKGFPVCVLLTKIDEKYSLEKIAHEIGQSQEDLPRFNLCSETGKDENLKQYCDLEGLLDWTRQVLPKEAVEEFGKSLNEKTISDLGLKSLAALWFAVKNIGELCAARLEASAAADKSADEYEEALRKLQEL